MSEPNRLKDRLYDAPEDERLRLLDKLRAANEESEYADLIRWCFEETEEAIVAQLKYIPVALGVGEATLLATGRLQGLELLKGAIFGRTPLDKEEQKGEGSDG